MKIGIISDIHSNYDALSAVIKALKGAGVDMIVNAGDNVGYSPYPDECIRLLRDENVLGVMGNYDEAVGYGLGSCGCGECSIEVEKLRQTSLRWTRQNMSEETREYLRELPQYRMIGTDAGKVVVMHGGLNEINEHVYPEDDEKLADISRRTGATLVVLGHTHRAFLRAVGNTIFVNPGSVGKPVPGNTRASYAIADLGDRVDASLFQIEYPLERTIRAIEEAGLPELFGEMPRTEEKGDSLA